MGPTQTQLIRKFWIGALQFMFSKQDFQLIVMHVKSGNLSGCFVKSPWKGNPLTLLVGMQTSIAAIENSVIS